MTIAPIRRSFPVRATPARAFVEVVMEPRAGGRWFERDADGGETNWGKVLIWDPPGRLVLAWQINASWAYDPDLITEVELVFTPQDGGTMVAFEHRNLERLGANAQALADLLSGGWPGILQGYADFAAG